LEATYSGISYIGIFNKSGDYDRSMKSTETSLLKYNLKFKIISEAVKIAVRLKYNHYCG